MDDQELAAAAGTVPEGDCPLWLSGSNRQGRAGDSPSDRSARLSVVGHLEELRRRVWICVGVVGIASGVGLMLSERLIGWLKRPAGEALPQLAFFGPAEAVVAYMKVAVAFGIAIAMPVVLWQCWSFISPGLTGRERRFGVALIRWGGLLFLAGCAFAYWVLLPMSLRFLMQFGSRHLVPVISVSQYLSFTTTLILACGAAFEVPIVIFLLARLGFVTPALLKRQWRQAALVVLVASALITPTPDIVSMLLVAVPMLALYEASIWVAGLAVRGRREDSRQ